MDLARGSLITRNYSYFHHYLNDKIDKILFPLISLPHTGSILEVEVDVN